MRQTMRDFREILPRNGRSPSAERLPACDPDRTDRLEGRFPSAAPKFELTHSLEAVESIHMRATRCRWSRWLIRINDVIAYIAKDERGKNHLFFPDQVDGHELGEASEEAFTMAELQARPGFNAGADGRDRAWLDTGQIRIVYLQADCELSLAHWICSSGTRHAPRHAFFTVFGRRLPTNRAKEDHHGRLLLAVVTYLPNIPRYAETAAGK